MTKTPLRIVIACSLFVLLYACGKTDQSQPEGVPPAKSDEPRLAIDEILKRYRATQNYRSSVVRSRARIKDADGGSMEVEMVIYRRRASDGSEQMLVEFTRPAEQKDRAGLILIGANGEIEGLRYAQGTNSFVSSKNISGEDSLFGMSLQELADGQPEKYNFELVGKENADSKRVYTLDGKLREGADSKFKRLVIHLAEDSFALASAEFYFGEAELARKVTVEKLEQVGGYWTRMRWFVDNRARAKQVEFETLNAKYDQPIPDSIFTREYLKKISSR
jgi:hypothetical protein